MRSRSLHSFLISVASLFVVACDTAPAGPGAPRLGAARVAEGPITWQHEGAQWIPCANGGDGEYIRTSGTIHYVERTVYDAAGGAHAMLRASSSGLTGEGMTTGDRYRGTLLAGNSARMDREGAATFRLDETYHFTPVGGTGARYDARYFLRATLSAEGTLDIVSDSVRVTCR